MISCDSCEHRPSSVPPPPSPGLPEGAAGQSYPEGRAAERSSFSALRQPCPAGWVRPLSWSLAAFGLSAVTDEQRTTWPLQAAADVQTDPVTDTHSAGVVMWGHGHSAKGVTM